MASGLIILQFKNPPLSFQNSIINGFQYKLKNKITVSSQSLTVLSRDKLITSSNLVLKYVADSIGFKASEIKRELQKGPSRQPSTEKRLFGARKISQLSYDAILEYVRDNI